MDEKRKVGEEQLKKKQTWRTPQTKIKKLKKDIETLQSEVENLLKHVQPISDNICCIVCKKIVECEELPCQHAICQSCYNNQIKNRDSVYCPICQKTYFNIRFDSISSSSSEEY